MKKTILRYGLAASLVILVLAAINLFVVAKIADYTIQEVAGYLTITLSMIFVFFGIRHYRDRYNNGLLTFGEGLKTGFLITLLPSLCFGLFDLLYTEILNPSWKDDYYRHYAEKLRASLPADQLDAELGKLASQRQLFDQPLMLFGLMFLTVFIIGMIVTIIASLSLRRNRASIA